MRFLESVGVPFFESQVPTLLFAGALPLDILLSHHVQLGVTRQLCVLRRLFSRLFADGISRPLLRCPTMSSAMSTKDRHAAHDKRRYSHHHKKAYRLEFSSHGLGARDNHVQNLLASSRYSRSRLYYVSKNTYLL